MNRIPNRRRWLTRLGAFALAAVVVIGGMLPVLRVNAAQEPTPIAVNQANESEPPTSNARAKEVRLTHGDSTPGVKAREYEGQLFVPLADFSRLFTSATYHYDSASQYATLTAPGLTLTAGRGASFLTANDRPLYGVKVNRMINNTMWVPLRPLAKALGLTVSYKNGDAAATVSGSYRALKHGSEFYREDEVYWLSRIISAESRGEPLTGQMAVGNIILNRMRSPLFPNTIWGVIFEKGQFSPVKNGSVYNAPAWSSVIAAKMCLEGYSISNDVLFFCNVKSASSHWIENNRTFAFRIGDHSFFL